MDEPTTHLDIPSIDALILALQQYIGTMIFISHDVYFIRQVAQQVLHIDAGRLTAYAGNYDYYVEKSRATDARYATVAAGFTDARPVQQAGKGPAQAQPARSGPKTKEQKRAEAEARAARTAPLKAAKARVQKLEAEIATLEKSQADLTAALEAPATYNEAGKAQQLNRELALAVARLKAATEEWERAAQEVTELEKP
jgi:ATP-binding cassette subfamily F protein 3